MGQLFQELKRRNVIRVAIAYAVSAWLLIQVSDTVFPILGLPDWSVALVTALLVIGFPVALIFAWAFELTPEGIKLEKQVVREESITHLTGRKLDFVIIAILVLALGYFSYDKFVLDPGRDVELVRTTTEAVTEQTAGTQTAKTADLSIAVLPFTDLSPEGDHEYFSDGISEEILNVLAHIPNLHVISRSSAFSFKGKSVDIPTVATQLGVANILEGSVRKSGNRIRITAQLVDARTDTHVWSETYDRELEDVFAVQDEIAAAIAGTLKEHLGLQVKAAPRAIAAANTAAHDAYLRGRYLVVQRTRATVDGAVREFEKAIALDPDFALAHAELGIATVFLTTYGDLTVTEAVARAAPHVERAMALDPTLAQAHAATGYVLRIQGDAEEALKHFRQALRFNPNYAIVYNGMGVLLEHFLGQYDEAFAAYETTVRLDPLSIPSRANYISSLVYRNRIAQAEQELEKYASIAPSQHAIWRGRLTSLGGNWADAMLGYLDALRIDREVSRHRDSLASRFAAIGLSEEALAISENPNPGVLRLLGRHGDAVNAAEARLAKDAFSPRGHHDLGLTLASAGDYTRARPILEEIWQKRGGRVTRSGDFQTSDAAALIAIRRGTGEEAEVGELVAAIRNNVRRYHEAGIIRSDFDFSADFEEGLADYFAGEREHGLALIAKGAEDGYFIPPTETYLQSLYDDPGFAPIRASQAARQAHERERFLAIVCADNPYAAVWQPAEGTCEGFAAAGGN